LVLYSHSASFEEVVESVNHYQGVGKGDQVVQQEKTSPLVREHDDVLTFVAFVVIAFKMQAQYKNYNVQR